ncbi:Autophagy-related protein 9 [Frankliniella fusca]|uniref:Autophagy-related protein 9 n=1 Tax=Frankliniella fusca TaxID=407009 RepID=A0AAE1H017_9NEOP|nr:Autophagy-related protein 9 [Frankliniella fusca]
MERLALRAALLLMLFVLLSADYSSLVSSVFTALGGTVVAPSAAPAPAPARGAAGSSGRAAATAPADLGPLRRPDLVRAGSALHHAGDEDEDDEAEDAEDVFDLGGGATAKLFTAAGRSRLLATMRTSCLPKLICELHAAPHRQNLGESERSLLALIRETSISATAEVTSKYHFAAHMGQLIAGVDGTGCHNFYPACPFPGAQVLSMMKKVRVR